MHRSPKFLTCTLNLLSCSRGSEVSWSFGDLLIFCPSCRDSLLVTVTSMNNNMEQFSQSHSFIACLYGEKKSRCQKNIFHSSAFISKSRKSPFIRGEAQKQLSKVEATTVTTAHTQTEGTFHCTNPTNTQKQTSHQQTLFQACGQCGLHLRGWGQSQGRLLPFFSKWHAKKYGMQLIFQKL
jgi:hypothetical protein